MTVNSGVAQAYYIHTDQLDTPRVITDTNGNVVWKWDNADPFGANMANENPNGAGTFSFSLRFPGQYYDRESNLHYNVNRDYDPAIGRYIQSDPIGLGGGINTYGYVGGNPLSGIDPFGTRSIWGAGAGLVCLAVDVYSSYDDIKALLETLEQYRLVEKKIAEVDKACPENATDEQRLKRDQEIAALSKEAEQLIIVLGAESQKLAGPMAVARAVCVEIAKKW